ncbi:hypothetical protein [Paraflavitalea speifideaquila]|uniref:hypothetical protein n=1 Tax=Paraflavitalea speifideaquila TaxID=3076558 RepID=UPI0028EB989E|nr:hypothetical protein [Paraflavitalea speifideiaquila]
MTIANLEWFAAECQQRGVKCAVANLPGDAINTQTALRRISQINNALKNGILDQYGAAVVDYNRWWQDPAYGDNVHPNPSLIVDDIHPSMSGYDSLAKVIFREAKLPVLTKAIFINELDPAGFTGYSRPAGVTINGAPYTISSAIDTVNINSYVPDSTWIKITSSTNITGTSYSGFSSILWYLDNNVQDSTWFTRKGFYTGNTKTSQNISNLLIQNPDYSTPRAFNIKYTDGTDALVVNAASNVNMIVGGTNPIAANVLSVYGSIGTNSNVVATGAGSQLGNLQVGNSSGAMTTGFGIGVYSNGIFNESNGGSGTPGFTFKHWASAINGGVGQNTGVRIAHNFNQLTGDNSSTFQLRIDPILNNTTFGAISNTYGGILFDPTITNQGGSFLTGFRNNVGNNYFNVRGGRTIVGDSARHGSALLEMTSPKRGFLPPRMTTAQRDSIGYISSIAIVGGSYTVAPSISITGGTGSGATANCYIPTGTTIAAQVVNQGIGYKPSVPVTVTLTGGTGSGGAATATISGPDSGLVIYNTTVDSLQYYNGTNWVNIGGVELLELPLLTLNLDQPLPLPKEPVSI